MLLKIKDLKIIKFNFLKLLLKVNKVIFNKKVAKPKCIENANRASQIIYDALMEKNSCLIARFGAFELSTLTNYIGVLKGENKFDYIKSKQPQWWWQQSLINSMNTNAGFFPPTVEQIEKFCELMLEDIPEVDILGSWLAEEQLFEKQLQFSKKVHLRLLEPFWADSPWTKALEGKKVVVVHPFAETIKQQYLQRQFLFKNAAVLPNFKSLTAIKSVQTLGEGDARFKDWFEALDYMKSEIDKLDYEVCLIGCGAYGFHLAAHVKRTGKKGIHLGGALQLLFGIIGKRWEDPNYGVKKWDIPYGYYTQLINEHWVRPGENDRPKNAEKVEGACYW